MLYALAWGIALFLLDRWSKKAIQLQLRNRFIFCGPFLRIRHVPHFRQYYKQRSVRIAFLLLWITSLGCALVLRHSTKWFQSPSAMIGLGLAFGGAAGNLLDICKLKYIVNFVDLRWWPVFNLADLGIVAGLAMAFLT